MSEKGDIAIYQSKDGETSLEVNLQKETVWLTQKQMGELFDRGIPAINEHIKNIYREEELEGIPTIRKFQIVQTEGKREVARGIDHYIIMHTYSLKLDANC